MLVLYAKMLLREDLEQLGAVPCQRTREALEKGPDWRTQLRDGEHPRNPQGTRRKTVFGSKVFEFLSLIDLAKKTEGTGGF